MDEDIAEITKESAKAIHPINSTTVHKICSGQVVLSLATAVKELVENALDAGATIIEVKLREQGIESIEVSDNGEGVAESNFEGLTAKYHTSKLREFTDLECVETFGFRGEALSSLCALSKMVITTRHGSAEYGTRLELDERGAIIKREICARQTGTTVQLANLFGSLPVRKKEFTRNIKKEFVKMCQILQGYGLVATKVRIICTNQNDKGSKSLIMATNGGKSVMDNISALFGTKQVFDLLQITRPMELDEAFTKVIAEELDPNSSSDNIDSLKDVDLTRFTIDGWISSCHHGSGRSSKDRQFIYINSRPCEPKKVSKIINEMYHRYNCNQNPFVYLNIMVQRSDVDVNVTPDKRQLLLNNENLLLSVLKACLTKTFDNVTTSFKMQNLNLSANKTINKSDIDTVVPDPKKFTQMLLQWKKTGQTDNPCTTDKITKRKVADEVECRNMKMRKIQEYLSQTHDDTVPMSDDETLSSTIDPSIIDSSQTNDVDSLPSYLDQSDSTSAPDGQPKFKAESFLNQPENTCTPERQPDFKIEKSGPSINADISSIVDPIIESAGNVDCTKPIPGKLDDTVPMSDDQTVSSTVDRSRIGRKHTNDGDDQSRYLHGPESTSTPERQSDFTMGKSPLKIIDTYNGVTGPSKAKSASIIDRIIKNESAGNATCKDNLPTPKQKPKKEDLVSNRLKMPEPVNECDSDSQRDLQSDDDLEENIDPDAEDHVQVLYDSENEYDEEQVSFKSQCTIDMFDAVATSIEEISELMAAEERFGEQMQRHKLDRLKFKATIEPSKNKLAEEELQTEISKTSFSRMEIIGQFNLGFIVVKLDDDLFIVDQHATDEKFNYETLQKETTLYNQKLVIPQQLELTAVSEMILIDNLEVFEKNGFKFRIDHDAEPTKKVQLTAKPMSKNWQFGKDEIDELIFLLQESTNTVLRPSKISAMFASRACRKSVMIGTSLSKSDMQRLISQMGDIEHPWNCPHGRPTMRHLLNLTMLYDAR